MEVPRLKKANFGFIFLTSLCLYSADTLTMPCSGQAKRHHWSLHNAFSFLSYIYARVLACTVRVLQAACMHHVQCVVMTTCSGGGCALLSGIVLILLYDYWLQLEREATCMGNMRTDVLPPLSTKDRQSIYVQSRLQGSSDQIPFLLIEWKSVIPLICASTQAVRLIYSGPFPGRKWIVMSTIRRKRSLNEES